MNVRFDEAMLVPVPLDRFLADESLKLFLFRYWQQNLNITLKQADECSCADCQRGDYPVFKIYAIFVVNENINRFVVLVALTSFISIIFS